VAFLLAGILLFHVVFQAEVSLATGFMEETWSRNLLNLMVSPMREVEYAAGVALFGLVKLVMGVGVVALTAAVFYAFSITNLGWALIPVAALLLAMGWIIGLFVIGLVLRFGTGAEALAWGILFLVMPLSGVFYPVGSLPWLLRPVAESLPTTHAFAAGRSFLAHHGVAWGQMGIATAEAIVMGGLAVAFLSAMLGLFRRRGYITRYS
jgi:ABC-2 type transport system permease protein